MSARIDTAAPQPAPVDRDTLVEVIFKARTAWANDGDVVSCPDEAIADALIADGWRKTTDEGDVK